MDKFTDLTESSKEQILVAFQNLNRIVIIVTDHPLQDLISDTLAFCRPVIIDFEDFAAAFSSDILTIG